MPPPIRECPPRGGVDEKYLIFLVKGRETSRLFYRARAFGATAPYCGKGFPQRRATSPTVPAFSKFVFRNSERWVGFSEEARCGMLSGWGGVGGLEGDFEFTAFTLASEFIAFTTEFTELTA